MLGHVLVIALLSELKGEVKVKLQENPSEERIEAFYIIIKLIGAASVTNIRNHK